MIVCKEVFISPKAHDDIRRIYDYVLNDGESIALNQVKRIYDGIEKLADFPELGKKLQNHVERMTTLRYIVVRNVYIVIYENRDTIDILRVFRKEQDFISQLGIGNE